MVKTVRPSQTGTVPWPDEAAAHYVTSSYWEGLPLGAHFLRAADTAPDEVALVDGRNVELLEILTVMERAGVGHYKRPERLVLVDALPTTNIGKTEKKALRADIAKRLSAETA